MATFNTNEIDLKIVLDIEIYIRKKYPKLKFGTGFCFIDNTRDWFKE